MMEKHANTNGKFTCTICCDDKEYTLRYLHKHNRRRHQILPTKRSKKSCGRKTITKYVLENRQRTPNLKRIPNVEPNPHVAKKGRREIQSLETDSLSDVEDLTVSQNPIRVQFEQIPCFKTEVSSASESECDSNDFDPDDKDSEDTESEIPSSDVALDNPKVTTTKDMAGGTKARPRSKKKKFPCSYCTLRLSSEKLKIEHETRVHLTEPKFICKKCGAKFVRPLNLKRHERSKSCKRVGKNQEATKEFKCTTCQRSFTTKNICARHEDLHLPPDKKKFQRDESICQLCGQTCSTRSSLRRHIQRLHQTDLCGVYSKTNIDKDKLRGKKFSAVLMKKQTEGIETSLPENRKSETGVSEDCAVSAVLVEERKDDTDDDELEINNLPENIKVELSEEFKASTVFVKKQKDETDESNDLPEHIKVEISEDFKISTVEDDPVEIFGL
jgi:hypothetical protein